MVKDENQQPRFREDMRLLQDRRRPVEMIEASGSGLPGRPGRCLERRYCRTGDGWELGMSWVAGCACVGSKVGGA